MIMKQNFIYNCSKSQVNCLCVSRISCENNAEAIASCMTMFVH